MSDNSAQMFLYITKALNKSCVYKEQRSYSRMANLSSSGFLALVSLKLLRLVYLVRIADVRWAHV